MLIQIIKNVVAVILLLIFMVSAYFFVVLKGDPSLLPWAVETAKVKNMEVVNDLQSHLSKLEEVTIDVGFFKSPEFIGLTRDYKEPLPVLEGEKTNPFVSSR